MEINIKDKMKDMATYVKNIKQAQSDKKEQAKEEDTVDQEKERVLPSHSNINTAINDDEDKKDKPDAQQEEIPLTDD